MKEYKQKDGTILKLGMNVILSDEDSKELMTFGKIKRIYKDERGVGYMTNGETVVDITFTKVIYSRFPDRWGEGSIHFSLRRLGTTENYIRADYPKPYEQEVDFRGFKVGMDSGWLFEDNLFGEIIDQKEMKFTWAVKRKWNSKGKRSNKHLGTISSNGFYIQKKNVKLSMQELKIIYSFMKAFKKRELFSINEPYTCFFCNKSMYSDYISCSFNRQRSGYEGTGSVCKDCCTGKSCKECNLERERVINPSKRIENV